MVGAMLAAAATGGGYLRGHTGRGGFSGVSIGGSTGNKYERPHQSAREKARNACGRVVQYVKPVWADANYCYTGKGKRTESRRP